MLFGLGKIRIKVAVLDDEEIVTGTQMIVLTIINK
jgi:hypothetical protein